MAVRIEREPRPNVTTYPESMRGGEWDTAIYAGSDDAALEQVRRISDEMQRLDEGRPLLRSRDQSPAWNAIRPQWWLDSWRHAWRLLRYMGDCSVCGRRTYAFDDGENDPRGILGDRAASPVTHEDVAELGEREYVPACFGCMNDEPRYRMALERARQLARRGA